VYVIACKLLVVVCVYAPKQNKHQPLAKLFC